jgi:hypothetical protein
LDSSKKISHLHTEVEPNADATSNGSCSDPGLDIPLIGVEKTFVGRFEPAGGICIEFRLDMLYDGQSRYAFRRRRREGGWEEGRERCGAEPTTESVIKARKRATVLLIREKKKKLLKMRLKVQNPLGYNE